jgi:hypothetical protein
VAVPGKHVRNDEHAAIIRHHGTRCKNLRKLKAYPCQNGKNMLKVTRLLEDTTAPHSRPVPSESGELAVRDDPQA